MNIRTMDKGYSEMEHAKLELRADDVCLYPQKAMPGKILYGGLEPGKSKNLPIDLVKVSGQHGNQLIFIFRGEYHIENIVDCPKPENWRTYGKFWLSFQEAVKLRNFLNATLNTDLSQFV